MNRTTTHVCACVSERSERAQRHDSECVSVCVSEHSEQTRHQVDCVPVCAREHSERAKRHTERQRETKTQGCTAFIHASAEQRVYADTRFRLRLGRPKHAEGGKEELGL